MIWFLFLLGGLAAAAASSERTAPPVTLSKRATGPSRARPGGGTTTPARPGGRVYTDQPTPGFWVVLDAKNTKNVKVTSSDRGAKLRAVGIVKNARVIAWRAYVSPPVERRSGDWDRSEWSPLDPLLSTWAGVKTLFRLKTEVQAGIVGGVAGDWEAVATAGAEVLDKGIKGIKAQNAAALDLVTEALEAFMANIAAHPANAAAFVDEHGQPDVWDAYIEKGTALYIPEPGYYDWTPGTTRPNQ